MKPLRIGIIGLGTVGAGLVQIVNGSGPLSQAVKINGISARERTAKRPFDVSKYKWFDDPSELAASDEIDVLVELIGGAKGTAKDAVEIALKNKKHVVTANKAMLAENGVSLAGLATENGVEIRYEAAVAGGIPIVKSLREGLAANSVSSIMGVMNGTSNYILTEMQKSGREFASVLADAQRLGLAEADPTLDISGGDAGHKLAILSALAFSGAPDYSAISLEGIQEIEPVDLETAQFLGYAIKLIACAQVTDGKLRQSVRPTLVKLNNPIAQVDGATNAVLVNADPVGILTFIGSGAGAGPTASAVAADLMDLVHGDTRPVFSGPCTTRGIFENVSENSLEAKFYVRFRVADRPGVIAKISDTLARHQVSIESFLQKPPPSAQNVAIVLTTQKCREGTLIDALHELLGQDEFIDTPLIMPLRD